MNRLLLLIFLFAIHVSLHAQENKVYAISSIINHDDGTGSGRIKLRIQDENPPFKIKMNSMEITTNENVVFFNKSKAGSYTMTISSSDESKESSTIKASIYQYIPDVYFVPIDSCVQISFDTTRQFAVPMKKIKSIQWYPKKNFSRPNNLQTELCYSEQKVGVKFEGVNDEEVYQKEINIYPLINECRSSTACDPLFESQILFAYELRDDILDINKFQTVVSRSFNKTRDYLSDFTRMFGYFDWDNVISIDNTIYLMPLRKNGQLLASSFIIFNNEYRSMHAIFVSREHLIQTLNSTDNLNQSLEFNAKLGLMQLVDFIYPGISDPNLVKPQNIFPNLQKGELCIGDYNLFINANDNTLKLESLDDLFSIEVSDTLCDYSDYNDFPTEEELYWDPNVSSASEAFQILMKKCCDN